MLIGCEDETGDGRLETIHRFGLETDILCLENIVKGRNNARVDLRSA
jgi:hypothetical protein